MDKTISKKTMTQSVDGKVTREAQVDGDDRGRYYWWRETDNDDALAHQIASTIKFIQKHQSQRVNQLTVATRLYGNSQAYNQLGASFSRTSNAVSTPQASRISFNLCASVVDTITAQIAKNKVVPTFITSGGIWGMQRKAEQLSKFIEGCFYEQDVHTKRVYQFRDAGIWGDGVLYVYRDAEDRAAVERAYPHEFLIDLVESTVSNKPRQLHRIKVADRGIIMEEFGDTPENIEAIERCPPAGESEVGSSPSAADLIAVAQSWHLPSSKKATNGLCVISLPDIGKVLYKEEYKKNYYPFVVLPYSKRATGFWGQGACERLQNIQGEINRSMILVQKSMWMGGSFKILSHISDKVPTQHFNNEVGPIIKWSGNIPPQYIAPSFIQPEVSQWIDGLIDKGFRQEGVSQMQAASMKPMGVNSGAALRTYDQITEDRQLFIAQQCEKAALEIARQMIEVVKDVHKEKGSYKVTYPNTNFIESIDWSEIGLKDDEYQLKAFPTSELPEEPMAKLETVQEYMQAGLITPRAGRRLLTMPDVEIADKLANAAEDLICKSIEDILYDGKNVRPDSEWDLNLAMDYSLKYMNYAKLNNCPEARLAKLRRFMAYINDALGLTQPPLPPMAAAGPAAPGGPVVPMANPAPTPTSNMIPNTAGAA